MDDEVKVSPVVDELGIGGARLMTVKHFDRFQEDQVIGPGTLPLEDFGTISVAAVVKWKTFPHVGVEFVDMTDREREKLFRYLFKVSRQAIRYERTRKTTAPPKASSASVACQVQVKAPGQKVGSK